MFPESGKIFKELADEAYEAVRICLSHFYEEKTKRYIDPIVVLSMIHAVHLSYQTLGVELISCSGKEADARKLLSDNLDDLKEAILNPSGNSKRVTKQK